MNKKRYHIIPTGRKSRTLLFRKPDGKADVMEHQNSFSGCLFMDGGITISGVIRHKTDGVVSRKGILLNLLTQSGDQYSVFKEEFSENDEIL